MDAKAPPTRIKLPKMKPSPVTPVTRDPPPHLQLAAALVRVRKLESELDNVKDLYLKLAARTLRLELALSAMAPDDTIRAILYPQPIETA